MPPSKPLLGISSCLLGQSVRYNGGHKKDDWLVSSLGPWVNWHPLCPEVKMGLGIPRETMQLRRVRPKGKVRLITTNSEKDLTALAIRTTKQMVASLPKNLNGFILKNRSPSCGLEKVKVYNNQKIPFNDGVGFFAKELVKQFPNLPVIDEGRLNNPKLKEHFVTQVFAHHAVSITPARISEIQKLHEVYKFLIQAHHEPSLRKLGPIAANSKKEKPSLVLKKYKKIFTHALSHPSSVKKRTNVIQHIYGFVKDKTSEREKKSLLKNIELYRSGELPFIALITLLRHTIEKHDSTYVHRQVFFTPYPASLKLNY